MQVFCFQRDNSVSPQLGTLGSFFEIAIFLLFQCLAWGPSPRSICKQDWLTLILFIGHYWTLITVLWDISSWALIFFSIIFLKLFELCFRGTWKKLSGFNIIFPSSPPLSCIKAPNSFKSGMYGESLLPFCLYWPSKVPDFPATCGSSDLHVDKLYPEREVRHSGFLGRIESKEKGTKGSKMLGIDE